MAFLPLYPQVCVILSSAGCNISFIYLAALWVFTHTGLENSALMLLHVFRKYMQNFLVSQNTSHVTEKRNILSIWERIKMNWEALTIWYCNIIEDSFLFIMTSFLSQVPFWKKAFPSSLLVQLGFQDLSKDKLYNCGLAGKESACSEGDLGSIPGLGRSLEEEKG